MNASSKLVQARSRSDLRALAVARSTRARAPNLAHRIAFLALIGLTGCSERSREGGAGDAASTSLPSSSISQPAGSGSTLSASKPSTSATATASATHDASAVAGTWEGEYNAKKGSVEMPAKVKDAARGGDDGKVASGAGTVSITISRDGEISGKGRGALGDVTIRGKVEDGVIRAAVFPDSPSAPSAMTGVLMGTVKEKSIAVELRVSGPDATIVRESSFELARK